MKITTRLSLFLLLSLGLMSTRTFAQKTEIGILLGGSYYWGDIVNTWQPATIKGGGSFFMRYHLDPRMAVRASLSYAKLGGADANSPDSEWQRMRNFSFTTDIFEFSGVFEYNLLADKNKGRRVKTRFVPYVYGGLGVFYFDPKAVNPITGEEVRLRPLELDGGGYSPIAICIPMGVGFRAYLNRSWQIGFDLGVRYSLSSHIDDVTGNSTYPRMSDVQDSDDARVMYNLDPRRIAIMEETGTTYIPTRSGGPRGKNEAVSDFYVIGGVTLSYRLWPKGARTHGGRAIRCPRFY